MALLHVLLNLPSAATSPSPSSLLSRHVPSSSPLHDLLTDFPNLSPTERAQRVYDSAFLEHAHMTAAAVGDTAPPSPADENNMHFLAFVKGRDGRFWELDGGWSGPIELGTLGDEKEGRQGEDCLSERALNWGPRRFAQVAERLGDWGCSCVAVVDDETR
jgi:ubiquitin carboxyl-terminal hydrolase L3